MLTITVIISKILIFILLNVSLIFSSFFSLKPLLNNKMYLNRVDSVNLSSNSLIASNLYKINEPETKSLRYAITESNNNLFLNEKNSFEIQPIASITKLMTALVVLDLKPNWEKIYEIERSDRREGGRIYLYLGDKVKIKDLFSLSLVGSANTATAALVSSLNLSEEEFVKLMNNKAKDLGLTNTSFKDPVGLSVENLSNAREVALLAKSALSKIEISETLKMDKIIFTTLQGQRREVDSTDILLNEEFTSELEFLGGKTGYIPEAGYCFVAKFKQQNRGEIIVSVLNSENKLSRFHDALNLANYIYDIE